MSTENEAAAQPADAGAAPGARGLSYVKLHVALLAILGAAALGSAIFTVSVALPEGRFVGLLGSLIAYLIMAMFLAYAVVTSLVVLMFCKQPFTVLVVHVVTACAAICIWKSG